MAHDDRFSDLLTPDDPSADGTVALVLEVHCQPGAGRTQVVGRHGDALKVRVAAPPEAGRANEALLAALADGLGVKAAAVTLAGGATSRRKRVRIAGLEADDVADRLASMADDAAGGSRRDRR